MLFTSLMFKPRSGPVRGCCCTRQAPSWSSSPAGSGACLPGSSSSSSGPLRFRVVVAEGFVEDEPVFDFSASGHIVLVVASSLSTVKHVVIWREVESLSGIVIEVVAQSLEEDAALNVVGVHVVPVG